MEVRRPAPREGSEPAADAGGGAACFGTSLRELRDLHSHLHHAADHCEAAYGRAAARKGMVVENTRKYVCDAVVRVVDHLGSAAASLESRLLWNPEMAEMEQRIACLNQRILTCQHYAFIIDLEGLRINPELPRHLPRYVFPPCNRRSRRHASGCQSSVGLVSPSGDGSPQRLRYTAHDVLGQDTARPGGHPTSSSSFALKTSECLRRGVTQ
ncbi:unnamed protein product [Spirodela intermedia]|uniref:Uncharacterized protein n=2 Tax=Spirodela intermedia TaxID=51605 RepID=A0A7I8KZK0_SPIIN|nr:unnamed protein product [Spirodela intermedia]CAA6665988.1 unnamed protein product [Spirodela intermedia]CAA7402746.1 unnamed protein product [Spirodela intermedia]